VLSKVYPVCVIGGGAAGVMAVLRVILNNDECLFFSGTPKDKKKSRAQWVKKVENIPGFTQYERGIEEPNSSTLEWVQNSAFSQNLIYKKNMGVTQISKNSDGIFEIKDSKDETHFAKFVILCTGVMDIQPVIANEISSIFNYANAQTVNYCLICDGHHSLNKRLVVLGHSLTAVWVSLMLYERYACQEVTILTNGQKLETNVETEKLIQAYRIKISEKKIINISGEDKGKKLNGFVLEDSQFVSADICFISLGMIVYNELAKQLGADLDERGFVVANENGETSVHGLYVAGDLKANTRKQIYTSWDNAVSAANHINQKLRAEKRKTILSNL